MCKIYMFHRLINNTDGILDVVFSRFKSFLCTITLRQRTKGVLRRQHMLFLCLVIEKLLNLEKTTSSVISMLFFIYDINPLMLV